MRNNINYFLLYKLLLFLSLTFFFVRTVIPINDLFWVSWILLFFSGVVCIIVNIKQIDLKKIKHILSSMRIIGILLGVYILVDLLNMIYALDYSVALSKYVIFIQSLNYFVNFLILVSLNRFSVKTVIDDIYKWVFASGFIVGIISIINYIYPFMCSKYLAQISLITDYNAFSRYFIFSYMVGTVYCYKNHRFSFFKKLILIFGYTVVVSLIILMTVSRRSLISFGFILLILIVYIIISSTKAVWKRLDFRNAFKRIITVFIALFITVGSIYGINTALIKYSTTHMEVKKARIIQTEKRNSFAKIVVGIVNEDIIHRADWDWDKTIESEQKEKQETAFQRFEDNDIWGKRKVIWNESIEEIRSFSLKELLFGRGTGYSIKLYEKEEHLKALEKIYDLPDKVEGFMHPHNYLLQDMLDGGIIKTILSLIMTFGIGVYVFFKFARSPEKWIIPFLSLILIATNIMISYSVGFIGDTYYDITLIMSMLLCSTESKPIPGSINLKGISMLKN